MPSLQNVLDWFRIVLESIGSANPSFSPKRFIWGFIQTMPLSNSLNYFIVIGKLFLWDCRRSRTLPTIRSSLWAPAKMQGVQSKLKIKYYYYCYLIILHFKYLLNTSNNIHRALTKISKDTWSWANTFEVFGRSSLIFERDQVLLGSARKTTN